MPVQQFKTQENLSNPTQTNGLVLLSWIGWVGAQISETSLTQIIPGLSFILKRIISIRHNNNNNQDNDDPK